MSDIPGSGDRSLVKGDAIPRGKVEKTIGVGEDVAGT